MKYIMEIPSKADFVTAYYMEDGLPVMYKSDKTDDLEPYTEPDRKAIEDEVWNFVKEIILKNNGTRMSGMFENELNECFGYPYYSDMFANLSYQEAKSKYEAWKNQKDEIHVGDEVTFEMAFGNGLDNNMKAVALDQATKGEEWCVLTENGCVETHDEEDLYKTGRTFPEVAELLQKMRGEEE